METRNYKKITLIVLISIIIFSFFSNSAIAEIVGCIDFKPNTLNINSCNKWVTVYIELDGCNPEEINISTIRLNEEIIPVLEPSCYLVDVTCEPGVNERMVKFNRADVVAILPLGETVDINITGQLNDGTLFTGTDSIRVIESGCEGDFDYDGNVDGTDAFNFKGNFFKQDCSEQTPCNGDFECDGDVDGTDGFKFKNNFWRKDCNLCE